MATATFADRLRHLRKAAGLSQVDLAGEDLSPSYISLLEAGKRSPSSEVLHQLAARLGCSLSQLVDGRPSEREERLALELAYARLAIEHGEAADARSRLERLLVDEVLLPQARDEAVILLARAVYLLGDPAESIVLLQPLYERACAGLSDHLLLQVTILMCACHFAAGDLNRASTLGLKGMDVARVRGLAGSDDYFRLGATVMAANYDLGDFLYARTLGRQLASEAADAGRPAGQAALYWNAAVLAEYEGRLGEAVRLCEQALARMGELENSRDFARLRLAVAAILMSCDPPDVDEAASLLERCHSDLRDLGGKADFAEWAYVRAAVLLHRGDPRRAEDQAREAVSLLGGQLCPEGVKALLALSDALAAQGGHGEAREVLREASDQLQTVGTGRAIGLIWRELGERLADLNEYDGAARAFRQALDNGGIRDRSTATRGVVQRYAGATVLDAIGYQRGHDGDTEGA